jgi:hypothetical protein
MPFVVEVFRPLRVVQGLSSPIASRLAAGEGVRAVLRVGVAFDDDQLTSRGWFFDTDAVGALLDDWCELLADGPWTARFDFRPTFELVARQVFGSLAASVPQLAWVELEDVPFGTRTRYLAPT